MDDKRGLRETPFAICRNKNTSKYLQNTVSRCNLKLAQQRGLLYQTRSDAVVLLWHTACKVHWESGLHENWRTASSKRERKTTCCAESKFALWITRSTLSRSKIILGNTKRSAKLPVSRMQHRGLPNPRHISLNGSRAGWTKAKLIEKFESRKYKEQFLQDMSQTLKINRFSEASQGLLQDMNQMGSFIADADEIQSTSKPWTKSRL